MKNHSLQKKNLSICPTATFTSDFRYSRISPASRQERIVGFTSVFPGYHTRILQGLFSTGASIVAPESSVRYEAVTLGDICFCWRFPPSHRISLYSGGSCPTGIPVLNHLQTVPDQTEISICLGVLTHFVNRVSNKHDSEIKFSRNISGLWPIFPLDLRRVENDYYFYVLLYLYYITYRMCCQ